MEPVVAPPEAPAPPPAPPARAKRWLWVALAALGGLAAGWGLRALLVERPPLPGPPPEMVRQLAALRDSLARTEAGLAVYGAALDTLDTVVTRTRARFERLRPLLDSELDALESGRGANYGNHRWAAFAYGTPPVRSDSLLDSLRAVGRLVPLGDNSRYVVSILEYSAPFVVPSTRWLISETARRFQDSLAARGLPLYRLIVTSATRTSSRQAALSTVNANAVSSASSHEAGVSVDVLYVQFVYLPRDEDLPTLPPQTPHTERLNRWLEGVYSDLGFRYAEHLDGLLGRVLLQMQQEGRWLVLRETGQPVYHLTRG